MLRVRNMISDASCREIANQFIIDNGNVTVFQSYDSPIVEIDWPNHTMTVYPDWNYSVTTGKYRNQFMRDNHFYDMADKKGFEKYMKEGKIKYGYTEFTIKVA